MHDTLNIKVFHMSCIYTFPINFIFYKTTPRKFEINKVGNCVGQVTIVQKNKLWIEKNAECFKVGDRNGSNRRSPLWAIYSPWLYNIFSLTFKTQSKLHCISSKKIFRFIPKTVESTKCKYSYWYRTDIKIENDRINIQISNPKWENFLN